MLMLINGQLHEVSEELGIAILADPRQPDDAAELTAYDVNVVLHGSLGILCGALLDDRAKTVEELLLSVSEYFSAQGPIPDHRRAAARIALERYQRELDVEEIGRVDPRDMFDFQPTDEHVKIIDDPLRAKLRKRRE